MDGNHTLRSGKYSGKTVDWLRDNDPMYLLWVEENRPEMLKEFKAKPAAKRIEPTVVSLPSALQPNLNFYNEPPDPISLPYLKKIKEQTKTEDEWNF